jgi:hypothetical protein
MAHVVWLFVGALAVGEFTGWFENQTVIVVAIVIVFALLGFLERDTIKLIRDLDQARDTITRLQNEISGLRDSLEEKGVLD